MSSVHCLFAVAAGRCTVYSYVCERSAMSAPPGLNTTQCSVVSAACSVLRGNGVYEITRAK
eukprot:5498720-Prymnesium_polylepis.1